MFSMRSLACLIFVCFCGAGLHAQTYADSIATFRKKYTADLLSDPRSPIKPSQAKYLNFFPPNRKYCVVAAMHETPGAAPFLIPTHSGKQKPFREYGILHFVLDGQQLELHVYQLLNMVNTAANKDDLFVPFYDLTNYETTYAGGRYIDLSIDDIKDGRVVLDFNKCYNPYCAYADGFSCPIPPTENRLHVQIPAGEKLFQR